MGPRRSLYVFCAFPGVVVAGLTFAPWVGGCAVDPSGDLGGSAAVGSDLGGKADGFCEVGDGCLEGLEPPPGRVEFHQPGEDPYVMGTFYYGEEASVYVRTGTIDDCGDDATVTLFAKGDTEVAWTPYALERREPYSGLFGNFVVPAEGSEVELWLEAKSPHGCYQYVSNDAQNYDVPIRAFEPTLIHFDRGPSWGIEVEGELHQGGTMVIDYDLGRLPYCRATYNGLQTWSIIATVVFDNGDQAEQPVVDYGPSGYTASPKPTYVPIPFDATRAAVYFSNTDRAGCHDWDSDFGRNFQFDIATLP